MTIKFNCIKVFYDEGTIPSRLEEIEDAYYALQRLESPGKQLTTAELNKKLDLED